MRWFAGAALIAALAVLGTARADEPAARAVLDRAIQAVGGEERLSKIKAFSVKGKGTITIEGNDIPFTFQTTAKGVGQYRSEFEGTAGGEKFSGVTVIDGGKGWRKFNDDTEKLEGESLANETRSAYLEVAPILLLPLKGKEFKLDLVGEEKVEGKPTIAVRATGPDGKDFTIHFDKESHLPVKVSGKVVDFEGEEFTQDTTFEEYQEFAGVKVATRAKSKKDGESYIDVEGMELTVLGEVAPETFAEPK